MEKMAITSSVREQPLLQNHCHLNMLNRQNLYCPHFPKNYQTLNSLNYHGELTTAYSTLNSASYHPQSTVFSIFACLQTRQSL